MCPLRHYFRQPVSLLSQTGCRRLHKLQLDLLIVGEAFTDEMHQSGNRFRRDMLHRELYVLLKFRRL